LEEFQPYRSSVVLAVTLLLRPR